MPALKISIATWSYDRIQAVKDGRAPVEGCEVTYLSPGIEELFIRTILGGEFDVSEISLSSYLMATSRGESRYRALPIFLSRIWRHSALYIRTDRGIKKPEDLKGRQIGVPEYQVTAALWARGMLADEYGVKASDVKWRNGGLEDPGREEKIKLDLPANISVEPIPRDRTLAHMLETGELDALLTPRAPSCFLRGAPNVGRLFADHRVAEEAYYKKTKLFPIMHVLAVRKDVLEENKWIASSLFTAFQKAKDLAVHELESSALYSVTLPWINDDVRRVRDIMGEDYWPYGIEKNRHALETALRYSHEQGLSSRRLSIEDTFVPDFGWAIKI